MGSFGQHAFSSFNVMANGSESQSRTISMMRKSNIFSTQRETLVSKEDTHGEKNGKR